MDNHFKIIVPFYNVEKWINATIKSILLQDYDNFECILIDDVSTDKTCETIDKLVATDNRFTVISNKEKKYVLENICTALRLCKPKAQDVVVILDGDDWFASKEVLSELNAIYKKEKCWLTYGSYMEFPSKIRGKFARKVPLRIVDNNLFREAQWMTSHLKTWKHGLWENIDKKRSFVEPDVIDKGNHFANCWDLAYMLPLIELAGKKIYHIQDILYVYNRQNPLNVDKLDNSLQLKMEQKIRNMKKYSPLTRL